MMVCNKLNHQLSQYFDPFLALHELLTFTLIHAACSTRISLYESVVMKQAQALLLDCVTK